MQETYPRDLVGYGAEPPRVRWPGDARVCLQFVINYEEGGENNILHGDAASEAFLSEMVGAQPVVGARHMAMESLYEYGSRAGFWRLHRLFGEMAVPVTVFGVATAMEQNPAAVEAMLAAGWEIASHGLRGLDYQHVPEAIEREHIQQAIDMPSFHSEHWPSSFWPRVARPGKVVIEGQFGAGVLAELLARGHKAELGPDWSEGRLSAARLEDDGQMFAGANPRGMQGYAVGR